jgi:hypothetical protein
MCLGIIEGFFPRDHTGGGCCARGLLIVEQKHRIANRESTIGRLVGMTFTLKSGHQVKLFSSLLKLLRRYTAQCGMNSFSVIEYLNVFENTSLCIFSGFVVFMIHEFCL